MTVERDTSGLSEHAMKLLLSYDAIRVKQVDVAYVNLMECVERSGLEYSAGRAAANELVQAGLVRIQGDLG